MNSILASLDWLLASTAADLQYTSFGANGSATGKNKEIIQVESSNITRSNGSVMGFDPNICISA